MLKDLKDIFEAASGGQTAIGAAVATSTSDPEILVSGPRHKNSGDSVTQDDLWHIGSITKSFTATLILQLVDSGVLELDAPIGSYLNSHEDTLHPDWNSRTLRQILSHTAGLPANPPTQVLLSPEPDDPSQGRIDVLRVLWNKPLNDNGKYRYSNIGYMLAGTIAEEITGKTWRKLIRSEIAAPLGITSLGFGPPTGPDAIWGHRSFLGFAKPMDPNGEARADNPNWLDPAGRIHMSLGDLITWGQAHLKAFRGERPEFLSRQSAQTMQTAIQADYGLGWLVQNQRGIKGPLIWHNGSNTMWYAVLMMAPELDTVLAVTLNRFSPRRGDRLAHELLTSLARRP